MAGGGYGQGARIPLRDRQRDGPASTPVTDPQPASSASPPAARPGRHCWLMLEPGSTPRPALLLEWRRGKATWEGLVVYRGEIGPGRWASIQEWIPAESLSRHRPH